MNYLVTGDKHGHFASVYTYLASIEENPEEPHYIETIRGVGYRFRA